MGREIGRGHAEGRQARGRGRDRAVYRWETVKEDRQGDSNRMVEIGQQAAPREIDLVRESFVLDCSLRSPSIWLHLVLTEATHPIPDVDVSKFSGISRSEP